MKVEIDDFSEFDQERLYLCQLITNTDLLRDVYQNFDPQLLSNQYSQIVGNWIKLHFRETKTAPGKDIATIFSRRSKEIQDKTVIKNISILLSSLSNDWEKYRIVNTKINATAILEYLNEQSARRLLEDMQSAIDGHDFARIPNLTSVWKPVQQISAQGESIFDRPDKYKNAFHEEDQRLFKLQGALGDTVGWFRRGEFSAAVAQTKGGKSFFKWYCSRYAAKYGQKVIHFNLEVNEKMFERRIWQDLACMPKYTSSVRVPFFDEDGNIDYTYKEMEGAATKSSEFFAKKLAQYKTLYKRGNVVTITLPRGRPTLADLKDQVLRKWEYDGYQADFVTLDYMDIIKRDTHFKDKHDSEDALWEQAAAWAAEDDIGILSSTQGNLESFDGKSFSAKGVGGVYKKLSHVDKLVALYSGELDKEQGVSRVKTLFDRDNHSCTDECIVIAGLALGRFCLDSKMASDVTNLENGSGRKRGDR